MKHIARFIFIFIFSISAASAQNSFINGLPQTAADKINELTKNNKKIDLVKFTSSNQWLIISEGASYYSDNTYFDRMKGTGTKSLRQAILSHLAAGRKINDIAITNKNEWILITGQIIEASNEAVMNSNKLITSLRNEFNRGNNLISLSLLTDANSWVAVHRLSIHQQGMDINLVKLLNEIHEVQHRNISSIIIRPGRTEWMVIADQQVWASPAIENRLTSVFEKMRRNHDSLDIAVLDAANGVAIISNGPDDPIDQDDFFKRVENQIETSDNFDLTLWDLMKVNKVPGIAIGFIKNNKIDTIRTYGHRKAGSGYIFKDTIFPVASLSKSVATTGIMKLVEKRSISLSDKPLVMGINSQEGSVLHSWFELFKKPEYIRFASRADDIILLNLLSHTAGLNRWGIGLWDPTNLPTLSDIILGQGKFSDTPVVPSLADPETEWNYSGGGFSIAEAMVEETLKNSFSNIMKRNVLDPVGMKNSTFSKLNSEQIATMAYGHNKYQNPYYYKECPGKAAGGLFSTVEDYTKYILTLLNEGKNIISNTEVISKISFKSMISPAYTKNSSLNYCIYQSDCFSTNETCHHNKCKLLIRDNALSFSGLGLQLKNLSNQAKPAYIAHGGVQAGYRHYFIASLEDKSGIVILTNGETEWEIVLPDGSKEFRGANIIVGKIKKIYLDIY